MGLSILNDEENAVRDAIRALVKKPSSPSRKSTISLKFTRGTICGY